jgi:hypothetical protein
MLARIFLVLLWWIGMWGLADLLINRLTKGAFIPTAIAYSSIIGVVLVAVWMDPALVEHF